MGLLDLLNHLLNFVAPALAVGCLLAYGAPFFHAKTPLTMARSLQAILNAMAGVAALGVGLWFFGRDGKMASYGAMVLACAFSQACAFRR